MKEGAFAEKAEAPSCCTACEGPHVAVHIIMAAYENERVGSNREFASPLAELRLPEQLDRLARGWGWFLAAGIAYIILGVIAYGWPVASTVTLTFFLGMILIVGGIVHAIEAVRLKGETGSGSRAFQAVVGFAAGVLMLRYPGTGMMGITLALAFYFFSSAGTKGVVAFGMRPHKGWGWALFSAAVSFALGVYILASFPTSALWVPGFLLGVEFVVYGASLIGFSLNLKNVHGRVGEVKSIARGPKAA